MVRPYVIDSLLEDLDNLGRCTYDVKDTNDEFSIKRFSPWSERARSPLGMYTTRNSIEVEYYYA